jgi:hypothetical protein
MSDDVHALAGDGTHTGALGLGSGWFDPILPVLACNMMVQR